MSSARDASSHGRSGTTEIKGYHDNQAVARGPLVPRPVCGGRGGSRGSAGLRLRGGGGDGVVPGRDRPGQRGPRRRRRLHRRGVLPRRPRPALRRPRRDAQRPGPPQPPGGRRGDPGRRRGGDQLRGGQRGRRVRGGGGRLRGGAGAGRGRGEGLPHAPQTHQHLLLGRLQTRTARQPAVCGAGHAGDSVEPAEDTPPVDPQPAGGGGGGRRRPRAERRPALQPAAGALRLRGELRQRGGVRRGGRPRAPDARRRRLQAGAPRPLQGPQPGHLPGSLPGLPVPPLLARHRGERRPGAPLGPQPQPGRGPGRERQTRSAGGPPQEGQRQDEGKADAQGEEQQGPAPSPGRAAEGGGGRGGKTGSDGRLGSGVERGRDAEARSSAAPVQPRRQGELGVSGPAGRRTQSGGGRPELQPHRLRPLWTVESSPVKQRLYGGTTPPDSRPSCVLVLLMDSSCVCACVFWLTAEQQCYQKPMFRKFIYKE